jgi:hypothetical protein
MTKLRVAFRYIVNAPNKFADSLPSNIIPLRSLLTLPIYVGSLQAKANKDVPCCTVL